MKRDDFPAVVTGGVGGPGEVGAEPVDAFHGLNLVMSDLPGEGLDLAAGDALGEVAMQAGGAAGARWAVAESFELAEELRAQGLGLFGARVLHGWLAFGQAPFPTHESGVRDFRAEIAPVQMQSLMSLLKFGNDRRYHLEFFFVEEPRR